MIMAMLDTSDAFDEDVHSEREALKDRCSKPTPPGLLFAAFTLTASLTPHSSLPIPLTPHSSLLSLRTPLTPLNPHSSHSSLPIPGPFLAALTPRAVPLSFQNAIVPRLKQCLSLRSSLLVRLLLNPIVPRLRQRLCFPEILPHLAVLQVQQADPDRERGAPAVNSSTQCCHRAARSLEIRACASMYRVVVQSWAGDIYRAGAV